jgi:hypothetical protein
VTLTIAELGSLSGSRGWYGTSAPGHTFDRGVRELGAARMQLIWSRARPLGFWASARGQQWAKVTGNLTWPVFEAMLAEIAAYEDAVGYRDAYRVTRRRAAPTPTRSRPPAPRPTRMSAYHKALVRWRARAAQGHRDPVPSPPRPAPITVLSSARPPTSSARGGARTVRYDVYARGPGGRGYDYAAGPIGWVVRPSRPELRRTTEVHAGSFPPRTDAPVARPRYSGQRPGETDTEFFNRMRRSQAEEATRQTAPFSYPRGIRYPEIEHVVGWHSSTVGPQGPRPPVLTRHDIAPAPTLYSRVM